MGREIILDGVRINDDSDCYVIAEIGNNHQGKLDVAMEMIRVAQECGADAVKFQKRDNRSLLTQEMFDMAYLGDNSFGKTYGEHREAIELGEPEFKALMEYSEELGMTMFSTAFDLNSVDFLEKIGIPFYKVASADLRNIPLLTKIAETGKPIILSTGGGDMNDVRRAVEAVLPINDQLAMLQCTAAYPALNYEEMNLRVITSYREEFPEMVIGLSDHENGTAMTLIAYMLGARIVEKHFTLNRAWKGTDHSFSLTPRGLRQAVKGLRRAKLALGNGIKVPTPSEEKPIFKMSKSIVAAKPLAVGTVLTLADLTFKSPGDSLPPYEIENVVGKEVVKAIAEDEPVTFEALK